MGSCRQISLFVFAIAVNVVACNDAPNAVSTPDALAPSLLIEEAGGASCTNSSECPADHPICGLLTSTCTTCLTPVECLLKDLNNPWCVDGACTGCRNSGDCGGLTPVCALGLLVCVPGVCVALDPIINGNVDVSLGHTGDVRLYTCIEGDILLGLATTACQADGTWSNPPPTCQPASSTACDSDTDCATGQWCSIADGVCQSTIANGGAIPIDASHTTPVLNGTCTVAAATLVCSSGVCDTADNKCGYASGHGTCASGAVCRGSQCGADGVCGLPVGAGPCSVANQATVCRSGTCSIFAPVCVPQNGCAADPECGTNEWCDTSTYTCAAKLANETPLPTVANHTPTLDGHCNASTGAAVCDSGVCSTSDNACGLPDGALCTILTASECRSGTCDALLGSCTSAPSCAGDSDCAADAWCNALLRCTPKLPNGTPIPIVVGHSPILIGLCTPEAASAVCAAGVCDSDNRCGYTIGTGQCTPENAGRVCRTGTCSAAGVCIPAHGCAADSDCQAGSWCDSEHFTCFAKLANGTPIPTSAHHTPTLDGTCSAAAGTSVCSSGVCSSSDNRCGYAEGDGPCTSSTASLCRSGFCGDNGSCSAPPPCDDDNDCPSGAYCDTAIELCAPKVANGQPLPNVPGHLPPLDGTCSDVAAAIVCDSGACDSNDNKCGHASGHGPCSDASACRSGVCDVAASICVDCAGSEDCSGIAAVCDSVTATCVQCSVTEDSACVGVSAVCDVANNMCGGCDGDYGTRTAHSCLHPAAPYCSVNGETAGACGQCNVDADCKGHVGGGHCDREFGACTSDSASVEEDDSLAGRGFGPAGGGCAAAGNNLVTWIVLVALGCRRLRRAAARAE